MAIAAPRYLHLEWQEVQALTAPHRGHPPVRQKKTKGKSQFVVIFLVLFRTFLYLKYFHLIKSNKVALDGSTHQ